MINTYSEDAGDEGKQPLIPYAIDGLRPVLTLPQGPIRALFPVPNGLFVLAGLSLYRVDRAWNPTLVGTVDAPGRAYMARNRRQIDPHIVLVVGNAAYLITTTVDFDAISMVRIPDEDLPEPIDVTFIDGYFAYAINDTSAGRFFLSAIDDGTSVSALDYATAETDPDRLVRTFRRKGELWLIGEVTIEVWSNNGNALFPFTRLPGVAIDRGCMAGPSVALLEEMIIWAADDGTVRAAKGYQAERISHHGVERSIQKEPNKDSIGAIVITKEGHSFYCLSGSTFTWVYDHTTKLWHERHSYRRTRWRADVACRWHDETIVGDDTTGDLYVVDADYFMEGSDPIVMLMRGPVQHDFPNKLQYFDLRLDVISGVGKLSGSEDDIDPHAMLRYSDDGGQTWSSQRKASIGRRGKSSTTVKFGRLGQSSDKGRVVEFSISAGVMRSLLGANAKIRRIASR